MTVKLDVATKHILWLKRSLELNHRIDNIQDDEKKKYIRKVTRGNIYLCDFGVGIGSEYQKTNRPCVIIQQRIANITSPVVIVAPITHKEKEYDTIVKLTTEINTPSQATGDSFANLSQIMTISKIRLGDFICNLNKDDMKEIDIAISKSLELHHYRLDFKKQLTHKENYISRLKEKIYQQDEALQQIMKELNVNDTSEAIEKVKLLLDSNQKKD